MENKSPIHESLVKRIWINDSTKKRRNTRICMDTKLWKFSRLFRRIVKMTQYKHDFLSIKHIKHIEQGCKKAQKTSKNFHVTIHICIIHAYHLAFLVNEWDYSNFLYTWNGASFSLCIFSCVCVPNNSNNKWKIFSLDKVGTLIILKKIRWYCATSIKFERRFAFAATFRNRMQIHRYTYYVCQQCKNTFATSIAI